MGCCFSRKRRKDDLYEPLLDKHEKDAVSNLLRHLESNSESPRLLSEALPSLTTLSNSNNLELQRSAALAFAEVSEKTPGPIKKDVLEPIFLLLKSNDIEVQRAAAAALGNLAVNDENKNLIISCQGLPLLVRLLLSPSTEVQCNICGCLTNLSTVNSNKILIAQSGAVPFLIRLCAVEDTRIQRNAAGTLLNLTHAAENRTPLVQAGVIVSFVKLLKSRDTEVQYYSAAALSNLAFDAAHRQEMQKYDDSLIPGLIHFMNSPSIKVQCQSALAIRNLASDEHYQIQFVRKGGLVPLLKLLKSSHPHVILASVAAIRNISILESNEQLIINAGFLPVLINLLSFSSSAPQLSASSSSMSTSEEIRCHSLSTLRNVATTDEIKLQLTSNGVIEKIILMINQSSSFVQVEMAKTLLPLTTVDEVRDKINNTNACETLLKLMNSASFEVQGSVATVLANLVNSKCSHYFVTHWDILKNYLLRFFQSKDLSYIQISLWTIDQLLEENECAELVKGSKEICSSVSQLRNFGDYEISKFASELYSRLSL